MAVQLKNLSDQVLVITGASSGIGLTTAKMAAERGAKVVLASRDEEGLRKAVDEIRGAGGTAVHVVADVGDLEALHAVAHTAEREFGGFDTWVNNAGGLDLRPHPGSAGGRRPPAVRNQLLGRRARLARGACRTCASAAER